MNYLERLQAMRKAQPRKRLNTDENKGTYSPRKLYRGLTVPYSNAPGRKRIHPKPARENVK